MTFLSARMAPIKRLIRPRVLAPLLILLLALASGLALARYYALIPGVATPSAQAVLSGQYLYAAQDDGTIHVYDINHAHRPVKIINVFPCCVDVRGAAAAAPTHRFYVMYNAASQGHLVAVDLLTDKVLWNIVEHTPGVDRGDVTPNGKTIFLPTWESDARTPYELVIDAITGAVVGRIPLPFRSHDTVVSLDGKRVFMETKSPTATLYIADTSTYKITGVITGYCCGGVLQPYAINGAATLVVNDVVGYTGFQIGDITTGRVIASAPFPDAGSSYGHGIAWTPNEREVWVNDGRKPYVHVFDMSVTPPVQTHLIRVGGAPHWVTFSIDGRFAYVAGPKGGSVSTAIIDTATYQQIGALHGSNSEDLLEVDFDTGVVIRTGDQFGIGRVTQPAGSGALSRAPRRPSPLRRAGAPDERYVPARGVRSAAAGVE